MLKTFSFFAFILIATRVYAQNVVCDPLCHQGTTTTTPTTTTGGGTTARGAPLRRRVPREPGKPSTGSTIAPQLPTPAAGEDNAPRQYLIAARQALAAGHTGEAQEALERAETRLADRSTPLFRTNEAARDPVIDEVRQAREALGSGDRMQAMQLTEQALATLQRR